MTIQILIADDHGVLRAGLRALLNAAPDIKVVGEAADGAETMRLSHALQPDVVLLDLSMPPGPGGIEITRRLEPLRPQTRVLILSAHEDESLLREAIQVGAAGYVVKRAIESELINAIRSVARGDLYVHPTMARALLQDTSSSPPSAPSVASLTPRETQVLRLIARGYTNRQIAGQLGISVRTVETHRANLTEKLGIRSRVKLVRYAREHGLLD